MQQAGFLHRQVDLPVPLQNITHVAGAEDLQQSMPPNECCGEQEFLKLHVYSMTDFKVVIHLDLDTLIVQPLDPLLDAMILSPKTDEGYQARQRLFAPPQTHGDHDKSNKFPYRRLAAALYEPRVALEQLVSHAYYTSDYNIYPRRVQRKGGKVGLQGGVMIVKPNNDTLADLVNLVHSGQFFRGRDTHSGWLQKGYG